MQMQIQSIAMRITGAAVLSLVLPIVSAQQQNTTPNPRPGQPGHRSHLEWQGAYPTPESLKKFQVVRSVPLPDGFLGNIAYDIPSGRLWAVSLGPPTNTKGPSKVYELDAKDGKILAEAPLPFKGDFGEPVYLDGYLYQGVFHESKMYKIVAGDRANLGKIAGSIPLPTLNDLNLVDEVHSYPFIEFGGVTVTPDKNFMLHADDVGEFITISRETGAILQRARTLKALGGIAGITVGKGDFVVLANSDPRGGYCALSYPPALSRSPEQKDISWALLDGKSGDVLASIRTQNSRAYASTVKVTKHEDVPGTAYGRFTFLATGEEGLVELQWTPTRDAY